MIQFPKNEHVTLPSVEAGVGSLNVLRDPPKAIYTHYKPKVGDTNKITQWIDGAGDRSCEVIKQYARGVNPMVSVSYSNYGTNGGQSRFVGSGLTSGRTDNITTLRGSGQSYLPYRIARDGAFRPPARATEHNIPLSRLPRVNTSAQTNVGSNLTAVDVDALRCNTDLRAVRQQLINVCSVPTRKFNIETPQQPSFDVNAMIDKKSNLARNVTANISDTKHQLGFNAKPERGIKKNKPYVSIPTKAYKNLQAAPLIAQQGNQPLPIQDRVNGSYSTNISGREGNTVVNPSNLRLNNNRPNASMMVNAGSRVDLNSNITSRNYKLAPRSSRGGFSNGGTITSYDRHVPNGTNLIGGGNVMQQAYQEQYGRV